MGLFRWFSVVAVAFVLAGMPPALAQGMPDEATRARVADWIERCGRPSDACWPVIKRIEESALGRWCRAIEAYWDTARLVRDPETVLHSIEELRGRREKAKEFLAECVPIFAAALDEAGGGDDGSSDAVYRGPVEPADRVMQAVKRSNLRRGPGTTHDKVGLLDVGDEVRVTGVVGDWLRIEAPAGGEAFVYGPLLAEVRSSSRREVAEAPGRLCADNADDADCWRKIVENPGCHLWVDAARPNRTRVSWSGSCDDGAANGQGILVSRFEILGELSTKEESVAMVEGRRHGKSTTKYDSSRFVSEGQYDRGVAVGRWISYDSNGECLSVRELSGSGQFVSHDPDCSNYIEPRSLDAVATDGHLRGSQQEEGGRPETTAQVSDESVDIAQDGPLHGSIAFSQDDDGAYAWGIAWSFDSSAGAQAEALGQCREYGGTRCAEAGWFQEACGALAIGDGNGYGTGWGATTGEAERDALAQCRVSNDDCRIEVARCSRSEEAGGRGRTEDQSDTAVSRSSDVAQPAVTSLEPKCPEDLYSAAYERPMKCWLELSNPPGCHYWISYRDASNLTHRVTWSGSCSGGVADGDGVLTYWGRGIDGDYVEQRDTGVFAAGIRQGRWIGTIDSEYANRRAEGDYLNGSKHGRWQFVQRDAAGGCAVADQFYSHGAIERYGEPREC